MSNVLINGRTAVHARSGGVLTTIDICWTKIGKTVRQIPYTNIATSSDAAGTASSVLVGGNPLCHLASNFAKSTGDEPGNRLGVVSGTIQGQATFISASSNVFIEGVAAVRQGDLMVSNNRNTSPMPLVQPGASPVPQGAHEAAQEMDGEELPDVVRWEVAGDDMHFVKGLFEGGPLGEEDEA